MLIKTIEDVGATLAWYPVKRNATESLIALGTKEVIGSGFDDYGASLEIHRLQLAENYGEKKPAEAKGKTSSRFASLNWSAVSSEALPYGLIAGGMSDGNLDIWDPAKLLAGHPKPQIARVDNKQSGPLHKGVVNSVQFNPHASSSHLVASGGADAEVFVTAIDSPDKAPSVFVPAPPPNGAKHTAEVTKVAWNTQVSHILATGSANGICVVWDLRQKRPWCELRDAGRDSLSDVCWNPSEGLHLATCSGSDASSGGGQVPVVRLWDLRSSTTMPLGTLSGHTQGILSMSWCPDDPSLLVSCGRDNKTFIWDFYQMKPVYELSADGADASINGSLGTTRHNGESMQPNTNAFSPNSHSNGAFGSSSMTESFFGSAVSPSQGGSGLRSLSAAGGSSNERAGFGGAGSERRYQVAWCPTAPALLATSSFDRKVQFFSMAGAPLKLKRRAPAWLQRPAGVALGFGGRLISFSKGKSVLRRASVVDDTPLVKRSRNFEHALLESEQRPDGLLELCKSKSVHDQTWQFMQLIFEENAREQLLVCLGYDPKQKSSQASPPSEEIQAPVPEAEKSLPRLTSAEDVFGTTALDYKKEQDDEMKTVVMTPEVPKKASPIKNTAPPVDDAMSDFVKRALLVGDFEVAVEKCLEANQLADALLVASCGGAELWEQTRMRYFEVATRNGNRPFLDVVSAIITNELSQLVEKSDLTKWRETLAVLATYGKSDEFAALCEQLGQRLEVEARDNAAASLCYMCAVNLPKTLEFWIKQLFKQEQAATESTDKNNNHHTTTPATSTQIDTLSLQELIERITVFTGRAPNFGGEHENNPALATVLNTYATILANQGELAVAAKYCLGPETQLLLHRLSVASGQHSASPFQVIPIGPSPEITGKVPAVKAAAAYTENGQDSYSAPAPPSNELPAPWVAVLDQTSNRTYYANPQTGQTQWEPPEAPQAQDPAQQSYQSAYSQQPHQQTTASNAYQQQALATQEPQTAAQQYATFPQQQTNAAFGQNATQQQQQYGTGFQQQQPQSFPAQQPQSQQIGTGFQQPAATQQYQTSSGFQQPAQQSFQQQPPQPASFPMQQQQQPAAYQQQAPEPAPAPPPAAAPLNPQAVQAINDGFGQVRAFLDSVQLNGMERKQVAEIDKALLRLAEKMAANDIEEDVVDRLTAFVDALLRSDFHAANNEQIALVNSAWNKHKDWLKGVKFLLQIVPKKI